MPASSSEGTSVHAPAARARPAGRRWLVYDGDCPLCVAIARALVAARLVPADAARPYGALGERDAARAWEAGVRDEVVALDPATGEARSGVRALLWLLGDTRLRAAARALDRRPVVALLTGPYRLVAYNRRYLAVPATKGPRCACDPPERPRWHAALAGGAVLVALGLLGLLGLVAPPELGLARGPLGRLLPAVAWGWPWLLVGLAGGALPADLGRPHAIHLAVSAAGAALPVGALALAALAAPDAVARAFPTLLQLALLAGLAAAALGQRRRLRWLGASDVWYGIWLVGAAFGALTVGWILPAL